MDFNIVKEATVHMTLRFRGGGTKFIYKVAEDRFDLIYTRVEDSDPGNFNYIELKKMIQEEIGIPLENFDLYQDLDGQILNDIKHKFSLHVS